MKYVIAPDGRLVAPVMVAMLQTADTVLFVPEYRNDGAMMELQVTMLPFEERGSDAADADRWRIHHGEPPDTRWAHLLIDAARHGEVVIDGEALMQRNPLADEEAALCKWVNAEHEPELRRMCATLGGMPVESPRLASVDPLGLNVRARFDVVRIASPERMDNAGKARLVMQNMMEGDHVAEA